jgi:hypothetical protein
MNEDTQELHNMIVDQLAGLLNGGSFTEVQRSLVASWYSYVGLEGRVQAEVDRIAKSRMQGDNQ